MKRLTAWQSEAPLDLERDGEPPAHHDRPGLNPFEHLARVETVERVRAAIASLPPVYREVVVLCELHEMEYATAAGILECPVGTVRMCRRGTGASATGSCVRARSAAGKSSAGC